MTIRALFMATRDAGSKRTIRVGGTVLVTRCCHRATERFQRFQYQAQEELPQKPSRIED